MLAPGVEEKLVALVLGGTNLAVCTAAGLADYTGMLWLRGAGDWNY